MNRSARAFLEGFEAAIAAVDDGNLHRVIVDALQSIIAEIPAADVVEVVRCKDCKYFNLIDKITEGKCLCDRNKLWQPGQYRPYMDKNDYCSYGERKEGQR